MNANELINKLEDAGMEQKHYDTMQQAATMLRKQQEEIEYWKEKFDKAMALNDQVKYLEAQVYGGSTK
jgi:hypothetical protein